MLYASMQSKHKDSRNMAVERHENPLSPFSTVSTERALVDTVYPLSAGATGRSTPLPRTANRRAHPQDELLSVVVVEEAGQLVRKLAVDPLSDVRHLQLLIHLPTRTAWLPALRTSCALHAQDASLPASALCIHCLAPHDKVVPVPMKATAAKSAQGS